MNQKLAEQFMQQRYANMQKQNEEKYNDIFHRHNNRPVTVIPANENDDPYRDRKKARVVMYSDKKTEILDHISSFQKKYSLDYQKIRRALQDGTNIYFEPWADYVKFKYEE